MQKLPYVHFHDGEHAKTTAHAIFSPWTNVIFTTATKCINFRSQAFCNDELAIYQLSFVKH